MMNHHSMHHMMHHMLHSGHDMPMMGGIGSMMMNSKMMQMSMQHMMKMERHLVKNRVCAGANSRGAELQVMPLRFVTYAGGH